MFLRLSRRGEIVSSQVVKWVLTILIILALGYAIKGIVGMYG